MYFRCLVFVSMLLAVLAGLVWSPASSIGAAATAAAALEAKPVEPDMHEFMEYVFQPTFKRLQAAMAAAPADNPTWKAIKADSLILAEGGNLLLARPPQDDVAAWDRHSVQVREFGGQLYRAAKAKNFAEARRHYESMITNCNACHEQFAGGEHILTP